MNEAIRMQMSAFVDSELPENEKELLLRRLSQDAGLRQQVAEYLAIGHALRGDLQLGGVNTLRDRIAGALDDKPVHGEPAHVDSKNDRLVRPLAGMAIAATVALVAIFGLRQLTELDSIETTAAREAVNREVLPTQPDTDEILSRYRSLHDARTSYMGANSINARLAVFERLEADAESVAGPAPDRTGADQDDAQAGPTAAE